MNIKDIAVYINPGHDNTHLYDALATLTKDTDCHVTGIYAVAPVPTMTSEVPIPATVVKQLEESANSMADENRVAFEAAMKSRGINSSWKCQHGEPDQIVSELFRYSDLGVVRQSEAPEPGNYPHTVNHILLNCGRPVIVIPYIGAQDTIGKRVVLGWNRSVQSTRAAYDAIGFMKNSEWVHVIDINKNTDDDSMGPSVPITEHLARHNINAESSTYKDSEVEPGDVLINHATDRGADLIVAGAWGHTRAREYIFGGTTRTLLEHMTVPVLFSH